MKASEIQELIAQKRMAIACAVTDRDPDLFVRRETELTALNARNEKSAQMMVDVARVELANREQRLTDIINQGAKNLEKLRDSFYNVDAHLARHHDEVAALQQQLKQAGAVDLVAKLARLEAQVAALKLEMGGAA
jgi:uncharacterized membrane-anchored protein YhcB (DUF1043 family)